MTRTPRVRKGMPDPGLTEDEFRRRFLLQFQDHVYRPLAAELDRIAGAAWDTYSGYRRFPDMRKAGRGFADPSFELATEWIGAHEAIEAAQARHDDPKGPARILIVNGSSRSEHTCPGEMSKTWRLSQIAHEVLAKARGVQVEVLELNRLASEYGRKIHPCKACFSTSPALCHWPCSCYPNHAMGQTQDWMNEIYPMWVAAHGVMILTPVNWYQVSSPLKLMIDRLVCADGGNPDPTTTRGKDAARAKQVEMKGWDYPRHLAGRMFSVVVHGDAEGSEGVRRILSDWLRSMHLLSAGPAAELDRYVGYWKPYATGHDDLDADPAFQEEVRNAARTLLEAVRARRAGKWPTAGDRLKEPRQK